MDFRNVWQAIINMCLQCKKILRILSNQLQKYGKLLHYWDYLFIITFFHIVKGKFIACQKNVNVAHSNFKCHRK